MTKQESGTFINGRGQTLHTVEFVPIETPKALLIFHHGYGEHTGRYDYGGGTCPTHSCHVLAHSDNLHPLAFAVAVASGSSTDCHNYCSRTKADTLCCHAVFEEIAKAGIAVHSYDCHGHGQSEPLEERDRALIWHFYYVVRFLPSPRSWHAAHQPGCCKCAGCRPR